MPPPITPTHGVGAKQTAAADRPLSATSARYFRSAPARPSAPCTRADTVCHAGDPRERGIPTFAEAAERTIELHRDGWKAGSPLGKQHMICPVS